MQLTGKQLIPQPQQLVWECLNDPAILRACIPGCESMERTADNEYKIAMNATVGPFKARFLGSLRITESHPPDSYVLNFDGNGGMIGFGKGSARVRLTPSEASTLLEYDTTAQVGGKLAQIGSRLVMGAAKKTADDFFEKFTAELAAREPAAAVSDQEAGTDQGPPEQPASQGKRAPALLYAALGAAVVAAAIAWMGFLR